MIGAFIGTSGDHALLMVPGGARAALLRRVHLLRHVASSLLPFMQAGSVNVYCPHQAVTICDREPLSVLVACNCGQVWLRQNALIDLSDAEVTKWLMRQPSSSR